jgi:hypothetical protein
MDICSSSLLHALARGTEIGRQSEVDWACALQPGEQIDQQNKLPSFLSRTSIFIYVYLLLQGDQ